MPTPKAPDKYATEYKEAFLQALNGPVRIKCKTREEAVNLRYYLDTMRRVMRSHGKADSRLRKAAREIKIRREKKELVVVRRDLDTGGLPSHAAGVKRAVKEAMKGDSGDV